ncbi:MAG TPA: GNAT family N-acetyltransferase [Candidatus Eisenbergiella stercoravium]|nr:GNAT family N-acetyltransferase [Candidatus Eisenbergiella stercoravium]
MEIIAYEMNYTKAEIEKSNILCIPFEQKYFQEYMQIYNACFWEMRKFLDIRPYNFLNDYSQILIVNEKFQNQGYGKQLLLWGMNHIRQSNNVPILLHVAKWNKKALSLYREVGFNITHIERIR